jgi:hypothetical protein
VSAILLAVNGPQAVDWLEALRAQAHGHDLRYWPDAVGDAKDISYACVWNPPHGLLAGFPHLWPIRSYRRFL